MKPLSHIDLNISVSFLAKYMSLLINSIKQSSNNYKLSNLRRDNLQTNQYDTTLIMKRTHRALNAHRKRESDFAKLMKTLKRVKMSLTSDNYDISFSIPQSSPGQQAATVEVDQESGEDDRHFPEDTYSFAEPSWDYSSWRASVTYTQGVLRGIAREEISLQCHDRCDSEDDDEGRRLTSSSFIWKVSRHSWIYRILLITSNPFRSSANKKCSLQLMTFFQYTNTTIQILVINSSERYPLQWDFIRGNRYLQESSEEVWKRTWAVPVRSSRMSIFS